MRFEGKLQLALLKDLILLGVILWVLGVGLRCRRSFALVLLGVFMVRSFRLLLLFLTQLLIEFVLTTLQILVVLLHFLRGILVPVYFYLLNLQLGQLLQLDVRFLEKLLGHRKLIHSLFLLLLVQVAPLLVHVVNLK